MPTQALEDHETAKRSAPSKEYLKALRAKNERAIHLLDEWMADESGYDEETWPRVKEIIEENRLSERKRFRP